jgi:regulator of protease activity HflC (stomatin/prohibitin superfamily)
MNVECAGSAARYGITFDAALITAIDPPAEVESALAAINTAHNQVSSEISLAQAAADQKLVMSRRAVEIETLNAQAEVEPLLTLAAQLTELANQGPEALRAYLRNAGLGLLRKTRQLVLSRDLVDAEASRSVDAEASRSVDAEASRDRMLEERHEMSRVVREEVSAQSQQWGYDVGSVYVRKVHFRDMGMIAQIEQKVVNRLRQVTAAIQQDGSNRVSIIRSAADREAAIELAKAGAMRPRIVGGAIAQIARRADVCGALFDVLEIQQPTRAEGLVVQVIPKGADVLAQISAAVAVRR